MKSLAYASLLIAALFGLLVVAAVLVSGDSPHIADLLLVAIPAAIGVTLWILAPGYTSSFATPVRVVIFLTGIFVLLSGMLWANFVNEYGDGTTYEITTVGNFGQVYTIDEASGAQDLVFEGTVTQAEEWVTDHRAASRDLTLPFVTMGIGLLVTMGAVGLGWHHTGEERHVNRPHGHLAT
ncbi:MAG: hypothetical protein M3094_06685 [Actinomycetia bacterium]|nr:hypothetical protein [Actinomycetes bacterium]